jgi:hypothetical protein
MPKGGDVACGRVMGACLYVFLARLSGMEERNRNQNVVQLCHNYRVELMGTSTIHIHDFIVLPILRTGIYTQISTLHKVNNIYLMKLANYVRLLELQHGISSRDYLYFVGST